MVSITPPGTPPGAPQDTARPAGLAYALAVPGRQCLAVVSGSGEATRVCGEPTTDGTSRCPRHKRRAMTKG